MEACYVQDKANEERQSQQAQELVSELGQQGAGGEGSESGRPQAQEERAQEERPQAQAPVIFCLAPDDLFDDDPDEDILQQVLAQGFLPCGSNGGCVGPWCEVCQWSSPIDLPRRKRRRQKQERQVQDDSEWDEPRSLGLSKQEREHERIRRLRRR